MTVSSEHGFALTLDSDTFRVTNVGANKWTRGMIPAPYHGLSAGDAIPKILQDLVDFGEVTIEIHFEGTIGLPALGTDYATATITHPLAAGELAAAKVTGPAKVTATEYPGGQAGGTGIKRGSFVLTWYGAGPSFTAATTPP